MIPELLTSLVDRARTGDHEAFEQILTAHQRPVLRIAMRLLGNPEDAQDAAQEAFLRLYRNLDQLRARKDFAPWLYRITTNVCLDMLRARRRNTPVEDNIAEAAAAEHGLLLQERKQAVDRALGDLPPRQRAAVVLRDIEGLSTAEVAESLGTTEATVRAQIYQARLKLRKLVSRALGRTNWGGSHEL
ncbi:MAG: sigma-70 family RNA polymerase sigma factor [Bryobacterales bacterium]|nr:sigma-70 family RNA polymerase sigma factor [Bryobacterales bacterium]